MKIGESRGNPTLTHKAFSNRNMAEALQQLILDTLDSSGIINDTRVLVLPGDTEPAATQDAQITILSALNSLLSRDVCPISLFHTFGH